MMLGCAQPALLHVHLLSKGELRSCAENAALGEQGLERGRLGTYLGLLNVCLTGF